MRGLITCHLFVNSIYSNIKYCFFASKICCLIIIWEYNSYFYFISRMCTDQLLFKIINIYRNIRNIQVKNLNKLKD